MAANAAVLTPLAPVPAKPGPGADLFEPGPLRQFIITVDGTNLNQLNKDDRLYVRCTVKVDDKEFKDVGVHVKGGAGSRRNFNDRPALTLKFDKFVPDQKFHGLEKIHLNNSVQDEACMTEIICGELFRKAGVPAARAGNAMVKVNNRDLGLYVIKEGFDKTFLKQYYKDRSGNLYDGGFLQDIDARLEMITGKENKEQPELKKLAAAAREKDPAKRWQQMCELVDMDQFITFCALDIIFWDWDGYPMKHNNYKLYWDPSRNKITFFPHGMDQMLWEPQGQILPHFEGLLARAVVQTPQGIEQYRERMSLLLTNVFIPEVITKRIKQYAAFNHDAIAQKDKNRARDYDDRIRNLVDLVNQRYSFLWKELVLNAPKKAVFTQGICLLPAWQTEFDASCAKKETTNPNRESLVLISGERTPVSWRSRMALPKGRYRFEGTVCTSNVVASKGEAGGGACLRVSGSRQARSNKLYETSDWQKLQCEFELSDVLTEIGLVCELRAQKGQARFDINSLRLINLDDKTALEKNGTPKTDKPK